MPRNQGLVSPEKSAFSGFIFKIQANMDPKHRDRIAFVRVCSGKFERDMTPCITRSGKKVRLSSSHKLFGNERETVDEAFPGDVIGLVGHDDFGIGDTLASDPSLVYREIPRFTPECFAWLHSPSTAQFKHFREGLDQLLQEGVVQASTLTTPPVKSRCWAPSARCSSRSSNTGCRPSTEPSRGWKPLPGKCCAGPQRTTAKLLTLRRSQRARASRPMRRGSLSCCFRINGAAISFADAIPKSDFLPCP